MSRRVRDEAADRERRRLWAASNDGLTMAIEFAGIPILFALLGLFLDSKFGTGPWLTVALAAFGIVGIAVRAFYAYNVKMEVEEEGKPWARRRTR